MAVRFPNSLPSSGKRTYLLSAMVTYAGADVAKGVSSFLHQDVIKGFPGGTVVENLPANAGDTGSSPGLGRSHMPRSN